MKDDITKWEQMTPEQKWTYLARPGRERAREILRRQRAAQIVRMNRLMGQWFSVLRTQERAAESCPHNETIDVIEDATEINDQVIEGGVQTRCVACKRLVSVS